MNVSPHCFPLLVCDWWLMVSSNYIRRWHCSGKLILQSNVGGTAAAAATTTTAEAAEERKIVLSLATAVGALVFGNSEATRASAGWCESGAAAKGRNSGGTNNQSFSSAVGIVTVTNNESRAGDAKRAAKGPAYCTFGLASVVRHDTAAVAERACVGLKNSKCA